MSAVDIYDQMVENERGKWAGAFKRGYQLRGRDWVRSLDPEGKEIFAKMGREFNDYGRMGGKARAATARRDEKGRFAKEEKNV